MSHSPFNMTKDISQLANENSALEILTLIKFFLLHSNSIIQNNISNCLTAIIPKLNYKKIENIWQKIYPLFDNVDKDKKKSALNIARTIAPFAADQLAQEIFSAMELMLLQNNLIFLPLIYDCIALTAPQIKKTSVNNLAKKLISQLEDSNYVCHRKTIVKLLNKLLPFIEKEILKNVLAKKNFLLNCRDYGLNLSGFNLIINSIPYRNKQQNNDLYEEMKPLISYFDTRYIPSITKFFIAIMPSLSKEKQKDLIKQKLQLLHSNCVPIAKHASKILVAITIDLNMDFKLKIENFLFKPEALFIQHFKRWFNNLEDEYANAEKTELEYPATKRQKLF